MGNVFVNEQNFWEQTKFFMNDGVVQNKNYEGRTIWIVQRNKELSFYKKRKKKLTILNQRFFLKKTFEQYNIKKTIFNEQFYKTIVFQWENEEIDGKWKITLRKSEIKFLLKDKKNLQNELWMNDMKKVESAHLQENPGSNGSYVMTK